MDLTEKVKNGWKNKEADCLPYYCNCLPRNYTDWLYIGLFVSKKKDLDFGYE